MNPYREPGSGPEPPPRGNFAAKCPHGITAKWAWCCEECRASPTMRPMFSDKFAAGFWLLVISAIMWVLR